MNFLIRFNANLIFLIYAFFGLLVAVLIKVFIQEGENSFYPILFTFVFALISYHYFSYICITKDKFKDLGKDKKMTDGAIVDSCYYLGFIFTLIILVTSFVSIGPSTSTARLQYDNNLLALMDILNRFCVGLFTTGYGLVARIHLSNLIDIEELDEEGLREKLNVKTQGLIYILDSGTTSLANLIGTSNKTIENSVIESTESIQTQSKLLAETINEITKSFAKTIKKLDVINEKFDLTDATTKIEEHLNSTSIHLIDLNNSIKDISTDMQKAGNSVEESSVKLIGTVNEIGIQNNNLLDTMNHLNNGFNSFTKEVETSEFAVKNSNQSFRELDSTLKNSHLQFDILNTTSSIARDSLVELDSSFVNIKNEINKFINSVAESKDNIQNSSVNSTDVVMNSTLKLQTNLNELTELISKYNTSIGILNTANSNINNQIISTSDKLKVSANITDNNFTELSQQLSSIKNTIQKLEIYFSNKNE
jgi:hypothetical protein